MIKYEEKIPPIRCTKKFKSGIKKLAKLQNKTVSDMIRDDYYEKIEQLTTKTK
jgi:hypothetical protein